jgi:hypothetical protein
MHTWLLEVVNVCDNDQENKKKHIGVQEISTYYVSSSQNLD